MISRAISKSSSGHVCAPRRRRSRDATCPPDALCGLRALEDDHLGGPGPCGPTPGTIVAPRTHAHAHSMRLWNPLVPDADALAHAAAAPPTCAFLGRLTRPAHGPGPGPGSCNHLSCMGASMRPASVPERRYDAAERMSWASGQGRLGWEMGCRRVR